MKNFKFEIGDLWALLTVINVALVITLGGIGLAFGLTVAVLGLISDFTKNKRDFRWNSVISHLAIMALNVFFLSS